MRWRVSFLWLGLAMTIQAADLVPIPEAGLRLQRGFRLSLFADHDLAPDTWCMTMDAQGRVVVANGDSIRILHDINGDGRADQATVFASLRRGAMGLAFDGTSLFVAGDEGLLRFDDANADGRADGEPEQHLALAFGEHGVHSIRRGPDGSWYVMGGNDAGFKPEHVPNPHSPSSALEAGALLRLTPSGDAADCVAHGFRNCYDFDFNSEGDIFTYDSDVERDAFLPWYIPTRIYHVGYGQHHGWRLPGYLRSWPRPEYYLDTVAMQAVVGRGSPTGVVCYRHTQFPPYYRDGLFFADWTFGRVHFLALTGSGAGYEEAAPEVFIEPIGTQGFAPTSLAVAPDGTLLVSIGGRKTRGAVYRVEYAGAPFGPPYPLLLNTTLSQVLLAPQPLDAWSRAIWLPIAQGLGPAPFARALTDESMPEPMRLRAVEVLTELFGGLPSTRLRAILETPSESVRARVAWSLGRIPITGAATALTGLAMDESAFVRRCALEALLDQPDLLPAAAQTRILTATLTHEDSRVRLAAMRLASRAPDASWNELLGILPRTVPDFQNAVTLAQMWRDPESVNFNEFMPRLTNVLARAQNFTTRLDAMRLLILALGDWRLQNPSVEVFTAYEPAGNPPPEPLAAAVTRLVRERFPSGNSALDFESARLLAMLQDQDRQTPRLLAGMLTETSSATSDFHYLICLARVRAAPELASRIANAILNLDRKLAGQELRVKQSWDARLAELAQQMIRNNPAVATVMLQHPRLVSPSHVSLASTFEGESRLAAARRFAATVRANPRFPWSTALVELLDELPQTEVFPLFRARWNDFAVRDAILLKLAASPSAADHGRFLAGLNSTQPAVINASLNALLRVPPPASGTNLVAPLQLLRRSLQEPKEQLTRARVLGLISSGLKQPFRIQEPPAGDLESLRGAYEPVFEFVRAKYPGLWRAVVADDEADPVEWTAKLKEIPWTSGDAGRGRAIFTERGCAACHTASGALGPDLAGSVQRLSREDLMASIVFPNRDIAPAYRTTHFRLRDGTTVTGTVAFESADGWIVQTGPGTSVRLYSTDVTSRQPGATSLMPSGLLHGLQPVSIADLYHYLQSLPEK